MVTRRATVVVVVAMVVVMVVATVAAVAEEEMATVGAEVVLTRCLSCGYATAAACAAPACQGVREHRGETAEA